MCYMLNYQSGSASTTGNPFGIIGGNSALVIKAETFSDNFVAQLAFGFGSNTLVYRNRAATSTWSDWMKIHAGDSDNLGGIAASSYLQKAGGTMTGHIYMGDAKESSSTQNTTQLIFGTPSDNHVAVSSIRGGICINPSSSNDTQNTLIGTGTQYTQFRSSGNFGIGSLNNSAPQYKLHVDGTAAATAFQQLSDMRKKDKIADVDIPIESIANAPSFTFKFKDTTDPEEKHVGTSAQYWQEIIPESVSVAKDKEGTLSLDYGSLAVVSCISLAKEVLELKKTVELLENRIKDLEKNKNT